MTYNEPVNPEPNESEVRYWTAKTVSHEQFQADLNFWLRRVEGGEELRVEMKGGAYLWVGLGEGSGEESWTPETREEEGMLHMSAQEVCSFLYQDFLMLYPCLDDGTWNVATNPAFRNTQTHDSVSATWTEHKAEFIILASGKTPGAALASYTKLRDWCVEHEPSWEGLQGAPSEAQLQVVRQRRINESKQEEFSSPGANE